MTTEFKLTAIPVVILSGLLSSTSALAIPFAIDSVSFYSSGGYGTENEGSSSTLLDVTFSVSDFVAQKFELTNVGDSMTFVFGSVDFQEASAHSGITSDETDDLGVLAHFTLSNPLGSSEMVSAAGSAITGSVNDSNTDFELDWSQTQVAFGGGGLFGVYLDDLSFTTQELLTQNATVTLLRLPEGEEKPDGVNVPEPGTLMLFVAGLAGVRLGQRRKFRE